VIWLVPPDSLQKYTPLETLLPSKVKSYLPAGYLPSARMAISRPSRSYTTSRTLLSTVRIPAPMPLRRGDGGESEKGRKSVLPSTNQEHPPNRGERPGCQAIHVNTTCQVRSIEGKRVFSSRIFAVRQDSDFSPQKIIHYKPHVPVP